MFEAHWPVRTVPPSAEEVRSVVNALKCHRAPGGDNLNPELLKVDGDALVADLTSLFGKIWESESVLLK